MANVISSGRLQRMCLKELRETLRDRRTIITLILMPLLVYPLLSMTMQRFLLASKPAKETPKFLIGVANEKVGAIFIQTVRLGKQLLAEDKDRNVIIQRKMFSFEAAPLSDNGDDTTRNSNLPQRIDPSDTSIDPSQPVEVLSDRLPDLVPELVEDWKVAISNGQIDLFLELLGDEGPPKDSEAWPNIQYRVHYVQDDPKSEQALHYFHQVIGAIDQQYAEQAFRATRNEISWPLRFVAEPISLPKSGGMSALITMVPLVLILMTITGAVYPAIDLTAGERERGTMEILIASPAPRWSLLFAKYVAVMAVALLTAIANLGSMFTTLWVTGLGKVLLGEQGISFPVISQIFCLLILFSMFFSACMLAITSFARSFKEAQAYLIPVMLLALAPGILSLLPGIEFTTLLAVVPLVNMVLLTRDLLLGNVNVTLALAAIVSTMVYAAAAIGIAARLFGSDAVLQGSRGSWQDLFARPSKVTLLPRFDQMAIFLALLFPLYFVLSNLIGLFRESTISTRLILNTVITALLFGLLPLTYCNYQKIDLRTTFRMVWPSGKFSMIVIFFSVLLGTSLWMAAHELFLLGRALGIETLSDEQVQAAKSLIAQFRQVSPWLVLFSFALTPAVFEEFFFRGFVLSSLHQMSRSGAILVSASLFGLFHVIVGSTLSIERFLPTTLMGLFLGWLAFRTQSLWPGVFLHATHNGLLLLTAYYTETLKDWGIGLEEQSHLPWTWLIVGVVITLMSLTAIELISRLSPRSAQV